MPVSVNDAVCQFTTPAHNTIKLILGLAAPIRETRHTQYLCIASRSKQTGRWQEHYLRIRELASGIRSLLNDYPLHAYEWHWCPTPLYHCQRELGASYAPYSLCRLGRAKLSEIQPVPNLVWSDVDGNLIALWIWDQPETVLRCEAWARQVAHTHGTNKQEWRNDQLLPIPSFEDVADLASSFVHFDLSPRAARPPLTSTRPMSAMQSAIPVSLNPKRIDWQSVLLWYRDDLHPDHRRLMWHTRIMCSDAEQTVRDIISALYEVGACGEEIAAVVWRSPYFQALHGEDVDRLHQLIRSVVTSQPPR